MRPTRSRLAAVVIAVLLAVGKTAPARAAYLYFAGALTRVDPSTLAIDFTFAIWPTDVSRELSPPPVNPWGGTVDLIAYWGGTSFDLTGNFGEPELPDPWNFWGGPGEFGGAGMVPGIDFTFAQIPGDSWLALTFTGSQDYYWEYVEPPGNWPNRWYAGTLGVTQRFAAPIPNAVGETVSLTAVPEPPGWALAGLALGLLLRRRTRDQFGGSGGAGEG